MADIAKQWDEMHTFLDERRARVSDALRDWQESSGPMVKSIHVTCKECFDDDFRRHNQGTNVGLIIVIVPKKDCPLGHAEPLED